MAQIIDGIHLARFLKEKIGNEVSQFKNLYNIHPCLAIIRIGENSASKIYVNSKKAQAKEVGILVKEYYFEHKISKTELKNKINFLNNNSDIHGIIVQLPLPSHLDEREIVNCIDPNKDVDGLHVLNAGKLICGEETIVPCTPLGCLLLLKSLYPRLSGLHALIIGRSVLVGRPMASILLQQDCTVTVAHSKTTDLSKLCPIADIVIVAIGKPLFVQHQWIKPGAIVLDVGINRLKDGSIVGDVDFREMMKVAEAISPVPGGVGPMTVACLLLNTTLVTAQQHNLKLSYLNASPLKYSGCLS